jgi:hypothetical protein
VESDDEVHVSGTIEQFAAQAGEGADLLLESYEESQDDAVIEELRGFTSGSLPVLQELAKVVPADAQDELAGAAQVLLDIDQRAGEACSACLPELPALQMPELFLTAGEVERALEAIQQTDAVDSAPTDRESPEGRPGKRDKPGGTAKPADGQPQPGLPELSGLPGTPKGTDVKSPRNLDEVVDGVGGAAGGLLDDVGETVEELIPEELDPLTDPLKDKVKDPVKPLTDPLKGLTDPLKGLTDPLG